MNGYEHPTRDTSAHAVYRLSWLASENALHQPANSRALPVPGRAFSDPALSPCKELNQ
ncbi:hypothetical protein HBB04_05271 (plasmid) [Pseudomonas coronafaciens]|nr:hypothetical protein HBB04_05271 [Pseudomonas coronafaciens]